MNVRKLEFAIFSGAICHAFRAYGGNAGLRNSGTVPLIYSAGMVVKTYV